MASITDLIMQQVTAATKSVEIPASAKDTVLNGLTSSVLGSLTQTASKAGGIDEIKSLLTGKTSAASSSVTSLATSLFKTDILSKLNLGGGTNSALTALIPTVMGELSNVFTDKDGDGDVDLSDILLTLKGGSSSSGLLGAATGILGGLFGKK